jgi:hypothetical protein
VAGGRVCALADKCSFYFRFVIFDHRGYDLGEIKPAVNAVFSQAIYDEKGIAAGSEMNGPEYWSCPLLVIGHIHVDVSNLRIMCRYKPCVAFLLHKLLLAFHHRGMLVVIHVPPVLVKEKGSPQEEGAFFN